MRYVKVKNSPHDYAVNGKIYKVLTGEIGWSTHIETWDNASGEGWIASDYLTEVTEAEYLAQEGKSKEVEFVVGKWYRRQNSKKDFIKFLRLEKVESYINYDKIYYSEEIVSGTHRVRTDFWANGDLQKYALENPCTIEEIQQYLPEGHPDKLIKDKQWIPKVGEWAIYEKHIEGDSLGRQGYEIGEVFLIEKTGRIGNCNASDNSMWIYKKNDGPTCHLACRLATPSEIAKATKPKDENVQYALAVEDEEQELIKEARRRGFVEGATYNTGNGHLNTIEANDIILGFEKYGKGYIGINNHIGYIYTKNLGWATIVTPARKSHIPDNYPKEAVAKEFEEMLSTYVPKEKINREIEEFLSKPMNTKQDEQPILISKVKTSNKIIVL